ncbi:MAG: hypothetical protein ACFFFH_17390, partial [Candidatus Thorarchaeota archaeon]
MRKHSISQLILIAIVLLLIFPNNLIKTESTLQKPDINIKDNHSMRNPFLELHQAINPDKTILPKTNLTVSNYLTSATPDNIFNATISSLNRTHWFIHCDYTFLSLDDISFDSIVDRVSTNHGYNASNYWEWHGSPSSSFDFWIDTTGFYDNYQFDVGPYTAEV